MADASASSAQPPPFTEQQPPPSTDSLTAQLADLDVNRTIKASIDDPPPAIPPGAAPTSSKTNMHARIAASAASHAALRATITSTQHAPASIATQTQQINALQTEWKACAARIKDLESRTHALQASKPRRFSVKLGSKCRSTWSSSPVERDKAYTDLWQAERRSREQQSAVEQQLDAAYAARAALEPQAQQHRAAQDALYSLHARVFDVATPELPDVFAASENWQRARERAQVAAAARALESSVLDQLCAAWAPMVAIVESLRSAKRTEHCAPAGLAAYHVQLLVEAARARQPRVCELGFVPMSPAHESTYVLLEGTHGASAHLDNARWVGREMHKVKTRLKEEIVHARRRLAAAGEAETKALERFDRRRAELRAARIAVFDDLEAECAGEDVESPACLEGVPADSKVSVEPE